MLHDYRVIAPGHIDRNQPAPLGSIVRLTSDQAEQFPNTFARVTVAPVSGRSSRRAAAPASDESTSAPTPTEE